MISSLHRSNISNVSSVDHSVSFSVFTDYRKEELMGWHPRGVTRTRARVIGVNFSEFLIKRKGNLVRVGGKIEVSEFELTE